jgi:hypothetical protein
LAEETVHPQTPPRDRLALHPLQGARRHGPLPLWLHDQPQPLGTDLHMSREPVKIVIVLEGGVVQDVITAGVPVEYVVIDYDTSWVDDENLVQIPQDEGTTADACVSGDMATPRGPWVEQVYAAVKDFNQPRRDIPDDTPCLDTSFHDHEMDID